MRDSLHVVVMPVQSFVASGMVCTSDDGKNVSGGH